MIPSIIASEGGAGYFPENTSYAVKQSLKSDLEGVELDFHLTDDNYFVAHHDYQLNKNLTRDQNQQWLTQPGQIIKDATLNALNKYELGMLNPDCKQADAYPVRTSVADERIATFQDIETSLLSCDLPMELWFEAKTNPYDLTLTTPAEDYVEQLQRQLNASELKDQIVLIAFDWTLLCLAKQKIPGIQTGFLTIDPAWLSRGAIKRQDPAAFRHENQSAWYGEFNPADYDNDIAKAVAAAGGTYWSPYFQDIERVDVAHAHEQGIKVSTWGADSETEIKRAIESGVDSLTTGYVNRAKNLLSQIGS